MDRPLVSVIIPARNAERSLPRTIESALQQTWQGDLEVIVAEGGSHDGTRASVERFGDRVKVIDNPSGLTPDGLNAAIAASGGQVIVRCDAHAWLPPDYVETAVSILQETGAANVGGIQHAVGSDLWERVVAAAQSTPLGVGDARYRLGGEAGEVDTVVRNQDYELNWRLRDSGEIVWFDPRLSVDYIPRSSLRALARQYFDYGRWKRHMLRLHPESLKLRQTAAPALVVGLLLSLVVAPLRPRLAAVVPGAYAIALAGTAVVEAARRRDPAVLLLPAAIPVMHLSWGTGFLLGQSSDDR
jgi:glycosyltransferase involved in cell wall biosynthesis